MRLRNVVTVAALTVLAGALAPGAFADDTDVTLTGGSLGITSAPTVTDFGGVALDGTATTTTATMDPFEVNDATGSGDGWHVTVQATQFAEHDGLDYIVGGHTLALNSLSMPQVAVAQDGTTSPVPSITAGPYNIDAAGAVTIASAAVDEGMGVYDFTQGGNLTLSLPASVYSGTYRSTVTVSVVTGP